MNELERLASDVRGFATDRGAKDWLLVDGGSENEFLELSERMKRIADAANRRSYRDRSGL
jgi:hypothetical protein